MNFSMLMIINGDGLIQSLFYLIVIGIVLGLLKLLIDKSPMPESFKSVLGWLVIAVGIVLLINFLLGLAGHPLIEWRR